MDLEIEKTKKILEPVYTFSFFFFLKNSSCNWRSINEYQIQSHDSIICFCSVKCSTYLTLYLTQRKIQNTCAIVIVTPACNTFYIQHFIQLDNRKGHLRSFIFTESIQITQGPRTSLAHTLFQQDFQQGSSQSTEMAMTEA